MVVQYSFTLLDGQLLGTLVYYRGYVMDTDSSYSPIHCYFITLPVLYSLNLRRAIFITTVSTSSFFNVFSPLIHPARLIGPCYLSGLGKGLSDDDKQKEFSGTNILITSLQITELRLVSARCKVSVCFKIHSFSNFNPRLFAKTLNC